MYRVRCQHVGGVNRAGRADFGSWLHGDRPTPGQLFRPEDSRVDVPVKGDGVQSLVRCDGDGVRTWQMVDRVKEVLDELKRDGRAEMRRNE